MIRYLVKLKSILKFLEGFKKDTIETVFTTSGKHVESPYFREYCWTPRYQNYWNVLYGISEICDMLGIGYLDDSAKDIRNRTMCLNEPDLIDKVYLFERHIDYITTTFKWAEDEIKNKLLLIDKEERKRLDEAINCYVNGCNYSAIAMAVSAIEFRLFSLMLKKCPEAKLDDLTLGQLIREYLDNPKKYGNIIPKKHKSLLEHCNVYRIFSVHPKQEKISRSIATSIINMSFGFLFDEKLKQHQ